jgi:hypothetical protein
VPQPQES